MARKVFLALVALILVGFAVVAVLRASTLGAASKAVELAKQDLAESSGIPLQSIEVVKVESVDWPDTSLGCPEEGKAYAQVITSGYRIVLWDGEQQYEYHSDRGTRVVLRQEG